MSEEKPENEIEVFMARRFEKKFDALTEQEREIVDEQIEFIIENPEVGERKKGDLNYLWVHKFRMTNQQYLLSYSWVATKLEIYLLSLGSHENFYDDQKKHRKADLKLIK